MSAETYDKIIFGGFGLCALGFTIAFMVIIYVNYKRSNKC